MSADAGNLDHRALGHESGRSRGGLERFRYVAAGRLADRIAAFADEEDDEVVAAVIVHAGDEGVAALDAVDEAVVAQKIERAIDCDRRRTPCRASRSMIS